MPAIPLCLRRAGAAALLCFAGAAHAADAPEPGLWEITTRSERNGVAREPRTRTHCIMPDRAPDFMSRAEANFAKVLGPCTSIDRRKTENGSSWRIQCSAELPIQADASYAFQSAQHYVATLRSRLTLPGETANSTITVEGKRIGECPK